MTAAAMRRAPAARALTRARRCLASRAGGAGPRAAARRPYATAAPGGTSGATLGATLGARRDGPSAPGPAAPAAAAVRAVRGATTVASDDPAAVRAATRALLAEVLARNGLRPADLISALFTVTPDLTRAFPAEAARELGWDDVPLLCALEIPVPGALPRCVRVLLHATSGRARSAIAHVYLGGAAALRPDLAAGHTVGPDDA